MKQSSTEKANKQVPQHRDYFARRTKLNSPGSSFMTAGHTMPTESHAERTTTARKKRGKEKKYSDIRTGQLRQYKAFRLSYIARYGNRSGPKKPRLVAKEY